MNFIYKRSELLFEGKTQQFKVKFLPWEILTEKPANKTRTKA